MSALEDAQRAIAARSGRMCYNETVMKFTVLGSGTSHGVPMIACDCSVCLSDNQKNKRFRSCLLVTADNGSNIVVDTPPEFRLAAIQHKITRVDSILYTHSHADHIFGLDDVRIFNWIKKGALPLYAESATLKDIDRAFRYCFIKTQLGGGKPQLTPTEIKPGDVLNLHGVLVTALRVMHGNLPIVGYKFGERAAFITDVSFIPDETMQQLQNLDLLFLDATRIEPHPTHFHLDKAIETAQALAPKQTYFVHLAHDYDHDEVNKTLPKGIQLAYDGLQVEL